MSTVGNGSSPSSKISIWRYLFYSQGSVSQISAREYSRTVHAVVPISLYQCVLIPLLNILCWQSTAKKDLSDEEGGRKDEILNKIRDAYMHPALRYVDLNVDQNSKTQRLLPESSDRVDPEIPV